VGWRLTKEPKSEKLTRELAEQVAGLSDVSTVLGFDRPLKPSRWKNYKKLMETNKFRALNWSRCFCKETGITYRVDGQHTSYAACKASPFPDLFVIMANYEADTLEDVRALWETFDTQGAARNASDFNNAFAKMSPRLRELPKRLINRIVSGLAVAECGIYFAHEMTQGQRANLILEHEKFAVWAADIIRGGDDAENREKINRIAVLAAMALTYQKNPGKAAEFWPAVRDGTGTNTKGGDRVLERYLISTVTREARNYYQDLEEDFFKCLDAWNQWRGGLKKGVLHYKKGEEPPVH
jgi:hypothetical protein